MSQVIPILTIVTLFSTSSFSQEILPIFGHSPGSSSLAFSPDGKFLATAGFDKTVKIWDVENKRLCKVIYGFNHFPRALDYSPNGDFLVVGSVVDVIQIFETRNYQIAGTLQDTSVINILKISFDGSLLAVGKQDGELSIWNLLSRRLLKRIKKQESQIYSLAFSPDDKMLLICGARVDILNLESYDVIRSFNIEDERGFSVDAGEFLNKHEIVTLKAYTMSKWSVDKATRISTIDRNKTPRAPGRAFALSPNGNLIATFPGTTWNRYGDVINELQIWRSSDFHILAHSRINTSSGGSIDWSNDGNKIALGGNDGGVQVREILKGADTLAIKSYFKVEGQFFLTCLIDIAPNSLIAASYSNPYTDDYDPTGIIIWDTKSARPTLRLREHRGVVSDMCYSNDRDVLFTGSSDNTIKMWDLKKEKSLHTFLGHRGGVYILTYSPNSKMLASIGQDKRLITWNIDGRKIKNEVAFHPVVSDLDFSVDGKKLIIACPGTHQIKILDAVSLKELSLITLEVPVSEFEIIPATTLVLAAGLNGQIGIWDMETGQLKQSYYQRYSSPNMVTPNGEYLISVLDSSILVRDTFSGLKINEIRINNATITKLTFDEKNGYLIFGDSYGRIQIRKFDGNLVFTAIAFPDNEWVSYTPENFFVGSKGIAANMAFLKENTVVDIDEESKLFKRFNNSRKFYSYMQNEEISIFQEKEILITVAASLLMLILAISLIWYFLKYKRTTKTSEFSPKRIAELEQEKIPAAKEFKRDVFLSHASEDKKRYVIPLAKALRKNGISFWLDSAEIKWGDAITEKINQGLTSSRFVIVFISRSFLNKRWPKSELNSALQLENSRNQKVVLPLLVENDKNILEKYSLILPKLYLEWKIGANRIAGALKDLLKEVEKEEN